jgi:hypothetical protein
MLVVPTWGLRLDSFRIKAGVGNMARPCLNKTTTKNVAFFRKLLSIQNLNDCRGEVKVSSVVYWCA